MAFEPYYLIPLCAALGYAVASLFLKRAIVEGAGALRTMVVSNWLMVPMYALILLLADGAPRWEAVGWPLFAGLLFIGGQACMMAGIRVGDVSVQAPLMGTKPMFVAGLTVLLGVSRVPLEWAFAAVLAAAAVFLLGAVNVERRASTFRGIALALGSSLLFAVTDLVIQQGAPLFGREAFMVVMILTMATASLACVPFFRGPVSAVPRPAWRWVVVGGLVLGVQSVAVCYAVGRFGNATAVNILYATRGVWGVVLVWACGAWFGNDERALAGRLMGRRLAGAWLLVAAVVLVFTVRA